MPHARVGTRWRGSGCRGKSLPLARTRATYVGRSVRQAALEAAGADLAERSGRHGAGGIGDLGPHAGAPAERDVVLAQGRAEGPLAARLRRARTQVRVEDEVRVAVHERAVGQSPFAALFHHVEQALVDLPAVDQAQDDLPRPRRAFRPDRPAGPGSATL